MVFVTRERGEGELAVPQMANLHRYLVPERISHLFVKFCSRPWHGFPMTILPHDPLMGRVVD